MNVNDEGGPCRIHQLPEFEDAGISPAYEYFLPVRDFPDEDFERLGPWLQSIARMDSKPAAEYLHERWAPFRHGHLCDLVDYYLGFAPSSLVLHDHRAWLLCVRPATAFTETSIFLLPEPVGGQRVRSRLEKLGFNDDLLAQFVEAFSGIREDLEPSAGDILDASEDWRSIGDDDNVWAIEEISGYRDWHGALFFYHSRGSDTLLVHPTGKTGWWVGAEQKIVEYTASFVEFCRRYTVFRQHAWKRFFSGKKAVAWPYDFYSSNEYVPTNDE